MSNFQIFNLDTFLSNFPKSRYFVDVLNTTTMNVGTMNVGIINLKKNQKDTQQPHKSDEIYYVISGIGKIVIDGNEQDVNPGKIIYIPNDIPHYFQTITNELIVLYILA